MPSSYVGQCCMFWAGSLHLCVCGSVLLSEGSCLVWLMEVPVEAALPRLQLQAALGFSLTYDNAPVTPDTKASQHIRCVWLFSLFCLTFLPASIHHHLSLLSLNLFRTPVVYQTQNTLRLCWGADHSRWRSVLYSPSSARSCSSYTV